MDPSIVPAHVTNLAEELVSGGCGVDLRSIAAGREFAVVYLDGAGPWADIARWVECEVFSEAFDQPRQQVIEEYGRYDDPSVFVSVIDLTQQLAQPAAALRMILPNADTGCKDVNDLLDSAADRNPWLGDIMSFYFSPGETYSSARAWKYLEAGNGGPIDRSSMIDVASKAVTATYRGRAASMDSAALLLYHHCLRYALRYRFECLFAIFDLKPFENLQQFGRPFDTFQGLAPRPYGGPFDTVPAVCRLDDGLARIYSCSEGFGRVFELGEGLSDIAVMPCEYLPGIWSNEALELPRAEARDLYEDGRRPA